MSWHPPARQEGGCRSCHTGLVTAARSIRIVWKVTSLRRGISGRQIGDESGFRQPSSLDVAGRVVVTVTERGAGDEVPALYHLALPPRARRRNRFRGQAVKDTAGGYASGYGALLGVRNRLENR